MSVHSAIEVKNIPNYQARFSMAVCTVIIVSLAVLAVYATVRGVDLQSSWSECRVIFVAEAVLGFLVYIFGYIAFKNQSRAYVKTQEQALLSVGRRDHNISLEEANAHSGVMKSRVDVERLQRENERLQEENTELRRKVEEYRVQQRRYTIEVSNEMDRITTLAGNVNELEQFLENQRNTQTQELRAKDTIIEKLGSQCQDLQKANETLMKQVQVQEGEIASLRILKRRELSGFPNTPSGSFVLIDAASIATTS